MKKYIIHVLPCTQFAATFASIYAYNTEAAIKQVENTGAAVLDIVENSLFTPVRKQVKQTFLKY